MNSAPRLRRRGVAALCISLMGFSACSGHSNVHASSSTLRLQSPRTAAQNVYAADGPNLLAPEAQQAKSLVYVPNSESNTVDVIDPATFQIVNHFDVGKLPQHVVPSWDLRTLYVANDLGNTLTPIDPRTGTPGATIPVEDPYNLYFTPDGQHAVVVAERLARLDFRDPHTMALQASLKVPCKGIDHLDFSADHKTLLASCEFAGTVVRIALGGSGGGTVVGTPLLLKTGAMPQDVKLAPDGSVYYVADMINSGVWIINSSKLETLGFIPTGNGAHGMYMSRDAKSMYVSNRADSSVSVIDMATRRLRVTWRIPGHGTPDMGGVSADGSTLWLSGRNSREVYAIDTTTGQLRARIKVGKGPHGLCVWPQPGTYSLGHTGIMR